MSHRSRARSPHGTFGFMGFGPYVHRIPSSAVARARSVGGSSGIRGIFLGYPGTDMQEIQWSQRTGLPWDRGGPPAVDL